MRTIFNAFCVHKHNHQKSCNSLKMLSTKLNVWMMKRAFKSWHMQGHAKMEMVLMEEQGFQTQAVDVANSHLGKMEKRHADQSGRTLGLKQ